MHLILVTGRSGSGKSSALNLLEDAGFDCMDNFPIPLLPQLFEDSNTTGENRKFAVSVDVRAPEADIATLPDILASLNKQGASSEVLFLDADTPTLIRRFSETRRKHPLTNATTDLQSAIVRESEILLPILNLVDATINTSNLTPGMLADSLAKMFLLEKGDELLISVESFGFKRGTPTDADFIFDVRCLPNPYWIAELREYSGQDQGVREYLSSQQDVQKMINSITHFLEEWIDCFKQGSRSYLTIGIGCTGGRHRSVFVAEQIKLNLDKIHSQVMVRHRDLNN